MNRSLPPLLLLLLACIVAPLQATPLPQIEHIAASGAPGLALELIDAEQPKLADNVGDWFNWERSRLNILARWQQWARAQQRLRSLDDKLPPKLRRWARGQRAWLFLEAGKASEALALLRELIWQQGEHAEAPELALWRRLVIRAYLLGDRIDDARIALHRYEQDYPAQGAEWARLRAEVWLRSDRAGLVLALKSAEKKALPAPLLMLARLRAGDISGGKAYAAASKQAASEALPAPLRVAWWQVASEAATVQGSPGRTSHALESVLLLGGSAPGDRALPRADAATLWRAWLDYGQQSANAEQLLRGDEAGWRAAVEASLPNTPVRARALLALQGEQSRGESREQALIDLAARIAAIEAGGAELMMALFLDPEVFPRLISVPAAVRHQLVDEALRREDIALASRLMGELSQRPQDVAEFDWRLRRARVLVMGGQVEAGVTALGELIAANDRFDERQADHLLQVVFDLQAVEQHDHAITLMGQLQSRLSVIRQQRELYYWLGDSHAAQGKLGEAARLYMRSATLLDPAGVDQWGQSARYRAAEVLTEAGLTGDARRLYTKLLGETESANRKAVLRNRLQQLWLVPRAEGDVSAASDAAGKP